jgi:aldose 1-epimerase
MAVEFYPFGRLSDGRQVTAAKLKNRAGASVTVLDYGATIQSLCVPARDGSLVDVVRGYDTAEEYERNGDFFGATIGRVANRIGGAAFELHGKRYELAKNDGENHLHGGTEGFSHRVWAITACSDNSVTLSLTSPDGDQGYPAALTASVTYSLQGSTLTADYRARADGDTYCNLTNHSYFNLAGHNSGSVLQQELTLCADCFTATDGASIPTGELAAVADTPMGFTVATAIGARIDEDYVQLRQAKGYDHNFVLRCCDGTLQHAATVFCAETGITMEVATTQPGVQVYTANYLTPRKGKGGCTYSYRHGLCLETQHFPDSPHQPHFPSTLLRKGKEYRQITTFTFSQV